MMLFFSLSTFDLKFPMHDYKYLLVEPPRVATVFATPGFNVFILKTPGIIFLPVGRLGRKRPKRVGPADLQTRCAFKSHDLFGLTRYIFKPNHPVNVVFNLTFTDIHKIIFPNMLGRAKNKKMLRAAAYCVIGSLF